MKRLLFYLMIFCLVCLKLGANQDFKIVDELGIPKDFLSNSSYLSKLKELSTSKKIQYYDNIIRKSILNVKIVKEEIEAENLPQTLFFIPLIESSFHNHSSKNGPSGLWQIMPLTANNLKLKRDEFVDERLDLIKSTQAATTYLKRYYKKFGKWYLAVLAYNAGEGRIIHGIARASLDNYLENNPTMYHDKVIKIYNLYINDYRNSKKGIDNLYTIYRDLGVKSGYFDYMYLLKHNNKRDYLPKTSVNYINSLVAFSILANSDRFKNLDRNSRYELTKVDVTKGLKIRQIADSLNMNYMELKSLNSHFLKEIIPFGSKNYNFYIPSTKVEMFKSKIATLTPSSVNDIVTKNQKLPSTKVSKISHKVVSGDTLDSISKKYKVSVKKLKKDNNKKSDKLKIGEIIEIYN